MTMKRKLAATFAVLAAATTVAPTGADAKPPDVREILDDLIVCVTEPCP